MRPQVQMEQSVKTETFDDDDVYVFPASFAQQRLWFLNQLDPQSSFYNVPTVLRLEGPLNIAVLQRALTELVRRHESLRTTFAMVNGEPVQVIGWGRAEFRLLEKGAFASEAEAQERLNREAQRPFDLEKGPLLRVVVAQLGAAEYLALLNLHHIISDGWSKDVLVRDLSALYEDFLEERPSRLGELAIQYADYAQWQREWLQGEVLEEQLGYWREQLANSAALLQLPTDRPRPGVQTYNGAIVAYQVEPRVVRELQALSKGENATLFMVLLAGFQALLYRHTGQRDIIVGTPVAGRPRAELEGLIGFFVNTLALRTAVRGGESFRGLLRRVREGALGAYGHQDVPFEKLVEALQPERNLSFPPLFQVVLGLQNGSSATLELSGVRWSLAPLQSTSAKFDLTLLLVEEQGWLSGSLEYNTDLFDRVTVKRLLQHYSQLLESVAANAELRVADIPLLSEEEGRLLLTQWQGVSSAYPRTSCVQELFEAQVAESPDAVALVGGEQQLRYGELNARANQLAHRLRRLGVGPEVRVGICLERGAELIVALLGILKAGGAYVPVDAGYPPARLAYMLQEAKPRVLLTDSRTVGMLPAEEATTLLLDQLQAELASESSENPVCETVATNLAYVMYTSGSTGRPKGVSVTHRSIVRLVRATNYLEFSSADVYLQFAPISFDASTLEIWGGLLNGGRVVVLPGGTPSLAELGRALQEHGVTTLWLTAGLFHLMVDEQLGSLRGVKQLLAGGDVLSPEHVQRVLRAHPGCRVINGYGPTENTTFTCCHGMTESNSPAGTVPIGRPIANTTVYLVDDEVRAVPVGVVGELLTGGDGLARGYYHSPELTAEKFIPDPYAAAPGGRLYRTGDLARFLADGSIVFMGRLDQQVKLRGFRVELGEVQRALTSHPAVRDAVVIVRSDATLNKNLIAYIIADTDSPPSVNELHRYLKEQLPEYMLPTAVVPLDEFPLNPNGKVNHEALPPVDRTTRELDESFTAPRSEIEEVVAGIWANVLGLARIGATENFFELGGHSLLATKAVSQTKRTFKIDLPLRALFESPTVREFAAVIEARQRASYELDEIPLEPVSRDGDLPLSFAQQRLWFHDQLIPGNAAYNVSAAVRLTGNLSIEALERALAAIIYRHESLRTTFSTSAFEPVQIIAADCPLVLKKLDLRSVPKPEREAEARQLATAEIRAPFDLTSGPLLRVVLMTLDHEEHLMVLTMHHIVSDGWSMGVLIREFATLYEAFNDGRASPLTELTLQYADYAYWQREWLQGQVLEAQLDYWRKQLGPNIPETDLPLDRPRLPVQAFRGAYDSFVLSKELSDHIKTLSRREDVTIFMLVLGGFNALLHSYSGSTDIVVGTDVANRNRIETENLIGFFANQLVLRTDLSGDPSFSEILARVREVALGAYAHQDLPFDKVVEALNPERDLSRNPLFQVMFGFKNAPMSDLKLPELSLTSFPLQDGTAVFDLSFYLTDTEQGLTGLVRYNTDIFDAATILHMWQRYERLLSFAVGDPARRLSELRALLEESTERELTHKRSELLRTAKRKVVSQATT